MKKVLYYMSLMLVFTQMQAQKDFQGMAVYESKTQAPKFEGMRGNRDITPEMQKDMEERMKKMLEKTFILNFDKSASIYKEEEKLESPGQQGGGMRIMMNSFMGGGGTFYKDVKTKSYTVDKEFMGKEFLVVDSLPKLNWKMEAETKQIGGYTCYKATAVKEASKTDFRNFRPKNPEDKKTEEKKEEVKKTSGETKTNFEDNFEIPKEVTITAWYSPEIPVNQGPENYWGLPGLILEINDGRTTILCSKIVLNAKDKIEIKPSKKGKVISQKDYDDTVIKKMEEFRDMNRGRAGGPPPMMGR
ncbi:GLPGLI family protein [Flavobacterium araucananum]|uniref:GLPGLI family protein n=1 Tax=Flavobacterium araucananum TaxID=946678 RepID=A0A227PIH4_9FLAO|nr:GLPGLI family protein [Flavobacterium araucananum]OXG09642.1 GLPGLI family protein [Flavobacterium araucananum]PWK02939.1 GLPGLI family protein [Flavobacterium araucananum]